MGEQSRASKHKGAKRSEWYEVPRGKVRRSGSGFVQNICYSTNFCLLTIYSKWTWEKNSSATNWHWFQDLETTTRGHPPPRSFRRGKPAAVWSPPTSPTSWTVARYGCPSKPRRGWWGCKRFRGTTSTINKIITAGRRSRIGKNWVKWGRYSPGDSTTSATPATCTSANTQERHSPMSLPPPTLHPAAARLTPRPPCR
jgi:hypothetical protein